MIDLRNAEIKDIMPVNLLTPESKSVSYAVRQAMIKFYDFADASLLCAGIDQVPDEVLDLLALELNTQYYDQQLPRATKEVLVSKTISWYMRAGTVSVLEEFLGTVLDGGIITEWFQYDGEPFCFKAEVSVGEHEIPLGFGTKVMRQINIYKNLRSHLQALIFNCKFNYKVAIQYDNRLILQSSFYPRYNLPFLLMDGTWKMDGSRKMSGYDSMDVLDFYPVGLRVNTEATEFIRAEPHIHFSDKGDLEVSTQNALEVRTEVQSDLSTETEMRLQNGNKLNTETETIIFISQETDAEPETESMLSLCAEIDKNIRTDECAQVCTAAECQIETTSYMTKLNLMDGTWKMDGSRKMDGGRYIL